MNPVPPNSSLLKRCPKCGETKAAAEYYSSKQTKSGLHGWCKTCSKHFRAQRYADHPTPHKYRGIKDRYKLTPEEYDALVGEGCPACGCEEGPFHVDHDHSCCPGKYTCGKCIRGILCSSCNRTLGASKEDPKRLYGLILYLENL